MTRHTLLYENISQAQFFFLLLQPGNKKILKLYYENRNNSCYGQGVCTAYQLARRLNQGTLEPQ